MKDGKGFSTRVRFALGSEPPAQPVEEQRKATGLASKIRLAKPITVEPAEPDRYETYRERRESATINLSPATIDPRAVAKKMGLNFDALSAKQRMGLAEAPFFCTGGRVEIGV
jgi:hypothetical protein